MRAGPAAVCPGSVVHRRRTPRPHAFHYPVSFVWLDPDRPEELCDAHPLWSCTRPAPVRFRRRDYGASATGSLADQARDDLTGVLGHRPGGEVRMLTQVRHFGWLFNPITVYVVWDTDPDTPAGTVLEVTNTPWKQRHRYPIAWTPTGAGTAGATVDKELHVSPFLDEAQRYDARIEADGDRVRLDLDVVPDGSVEPVLVTSLAVVRHPVTRRALSRDLMTNIASTHRVSLGIHVQAVRLWLKRVPFVTHPSKREVIRSPQRARPDIHPDRLLDHAQSSAAVSVSERLTASAATVSMHALLGRISHEQLVVQERLPGRTPSDRTYGPGGELRAMVTVHDRRAYSAVLMEGSAGFGRGFIEGWWTSDDPVAVVRVVIRNLAAFDRLRNRWHRATGWATDRIRAALPRDSRERNRDDIGAHYDIGNEFFELFLDETMTYSSGVFATPETTLADASRRKYDMLLDKLQMSSEHSLLEIGTGWGGLAIRAAGTRRCDVTTTTISAEQLREAEKRIANAGLADRVSVLDSDWRDLSGQFDRVISIEMIEAVDWRDYDEYFRTIERCMRPDGIAVIQAIVVPDDRWERAKNTVDFIRRFVFPNGFLPSVASIDAAVRSSTSMRVVDVEDLAPHYAETLRRWRTRFDERLDEVADLGLDDRFQRLWRFYLAYCEAGFHERHCSVVQIVLAGGEHPAVTG